jgi:hypothetical protein
MPVPEHLCVRLTFRDGATPEERQDAHAYLYLKLEELLNEAPPFIAYRVLPSTLDQD